MLPFCYQEKQQNIVNFLHFIIDILYIVLIFKISLIFSDNIGYILDKIDCVLFLLCTQFGIIFVVY